MPLSGPVLPTGEGRRGSYHCNRQHMGKVDTGDEGWSLKLWLHSRHLPSGIWDVTGVLLRPQQASHKLWFCVRGSMGHWRVLLQPLFHAPVTRHCARCWRQTESLRSSVQDEYNGEKSPGDVGGRICNITEILWETQPCRGQKHMCKGPEAGMCQVWRILRTVHEALPSPATADLPPQSHKSCPLFPRSFPSSGSLYILFPPLSALLLWVLAYGESDLTSQPQEDPILSTPGAFLPMHLDFSYQVLLVWSVWEIVSWTHGLSAPRARTLPAQCITTRLRPAQRFWVFWLGQVLAAALGFSRCGTQA